jgi:hypothetical protein
MTLVEQLAAFVVRASYDELSAAARDQLKFAFWTRLAARSAR